MAYVKLSYIKIVNNHDFITFVTWLSTEYYCRLTDLINALMERRVNLDSDPLNMRGGNLGQA